MSADVIDVNAAAVDLIGNEYLVTIGGSNSKTTKWRLGRRMMLMLIFKAAEAEGLDIPDGTLEGLDRPEPGQWTPWVVKAEKPFE